MAATSSPTATIPRPNSAHRRFILLGFFYSEAEEALRRKINAERRAAEAESPA